jgi:membrane-associated phospholipid phosphatase
MAAFSTLGEHAAIWFALSGVAALRARDDEQRRAAGRAAATILGVFVVNVVIKNVVRRQRPKIPGLPPLVGTPTGLSFPSTHAGTSFAGARALAEAGLPAVPLRILAISLAASRLYLGVHYPSDIAAGAALGHALGGLGT